MPCLAPVGQPWAQVLVWRQPGAARATSSYDQPMASMPRANTLVLAGHGRCERVTPSICSAHA